MISARRDSNQIDSTVNNNSLNHPGFSEHDNDWNERLLTRKILVVDDQVFNIEAIVNIMRVLNLPTNIEIVRALNGKYALDVVKSDIIKHEGLNCSF